MRLVTFQKNSKQKLGVWLDPFIIDIQAAGSILVDKTPGSQRFSADCESMVSLLQAPEEIWPMLRSVVDQIVSSGTTNQEKLLERGILVLLHDVTLLAPLPSPGKVICAAGNYPSAADSQRPDFPIIFLKPSSSITGPGMSIWIPEMAKSVAYEVELALVIGKRARHVLPEDAMAYVAGFTLANDVGDRLLEKRTSQWTSGKMFDSFTPLGPWLVTKDEIPQPDNLAMSTLVNGQIVQKGSTGDMFFGVPELVSILSNLTTLQPGDLILTGSPKLMDGQQNPVISLQPGDTVAIRIDSLGELNNPVEKEPSCP